jgi:DNA replication and repair protein RecF
VYLEGVTLSDFRNYPSLRFTPAPSLNVLTGANAQGKTNLLEGLGLLMVGRSFRGARAVELPRWGAPEARLGCTLRRVDTSRPIERVVARREDGAWALAGEGCSWSRAVPFGWQDLVILNGGPQARRGFLDGFAAKLSPAHAAVVGRYRRVLERRNRLLQSGLGAAGLRGRIEPWDEQLIEVGLELLARRLAALSLLETEVRRIWRRLALDGEARLAYRGSIGEPPGPAAFRDEIGRRLGEEVRRGQTLLGPHRDDVSIELDGRDLRVYGSRGQQRLMTLALRLAEAGPVADAVGSQPVLLLDDPLSELDPEAQARLLDHVSGIGQVFLTTPEPVALGARAAWWEVKGAAVRDTSVLAERGAA